MSTQTSRPAGEPEASLGPERTIGQLVSDATRDISDIVRHEVALAKAEIKRDVIHGAVAGGMFGAAGVFSFLAVIMLLIAAAFALVAAGLPEWAGFLIVGGALLLMAAILGLIGKSRISKVGPPERTIRTTKETVAALKGNGSAPE